MKIKITISIIVLILIARFSFAQEENTWKGVTYINKSFKGLNYFPDSIRIEFPEHKALVSFSLKNVAKDVSLVGQFADSLASWLTIIEKSLPETTTPRRVEIRSWKNEETKIILHEPLEKVTRLMTKGKTTTELLPPGWELFVEAKDFKVYVYAQQFADLIQVAKLGLRPAVEKVTAEQQVHPLHRHNLKSRIILSGDRVMYSEMKQRQPPDFLTIHGSAGLGFLGDKFYPEINADVSLRFSDRFNRMNHKVMFNYNNLFFLESRPEGGYLTNVNSFISVSWNKNLEYKSTQPSWLGVGIGYLVSGSGNYFTGNTMKFFINKDVGSVRISPELYLTDDFKKSLLGIKFNFIF